jgi:hypothetical protein
VAKFVDKNGDLNDSLLRERNISRSEFLLNFVCYLLGEDTGITILLLMIGASASASATATTTSATATEGTGAVSVGATVGVKGPSGSPMIGSICVGLGTSKGAWC